MVVSNRAPAALRRMRLGDVSVIATAEFPAHQALKRCRAGQPLVWPATGVLG